MKFWSVVSKIRKLLIGEGGGMNAMVRGLPVVRRAGILSVALWW